ncbi:VWA domain-containing protein [Actinophytocola algeriensis]|uniref:Ca-activated chloride channel family protein n=1 Tax=Actinophytocola algeriensis TaxID=1768010 RepID=A0A7W7Q6H9_9PSEU|nr:VWA domain-containing protein [Actinophytocola algeriensis]MBB4907869.1 Ca-activated chloride channel family protein [Actinophytocola algeriensis]MBE1479899.1 Ca-activated chloride channel family protein [Actinophytocola algeriensis]
MTFLASGRLWLLAGVVALVVLYAVLQVRRSRFAVRFTNLPLLEKVAPTRPGWRRHLPASLFVIMLGLLVVGFAQPAAAVQVPRERATVIIAVDVSPSMGADDVPPDRLAAARTAAHDFVDLLPGQFNVGLVAFAGTAQVVVAPVTDRDALRSGIDRLTTGTVAQPGTAIGDAIAASLQAVRTVDPTAAAEPPPARVVVLSDGANTQGTDPGVAAAEAAAAEVPVDTISVGTEGGAISQNGRDMAVPVDGATLRDVAERTGGSYHEAATTNELRDVYADIGSSVGFRTEQQDVSYRFIGLGLLFGLATAGTSLLWFSRLP